MKAETPRWGLIASSTVYSAELREAWDAVPKGLRARIKFPKAPTKKTLADVEDVVVVTDFDSLLTEEVDPTDELKSSDLRYLVLGEAVAPDRIAATVMRLGVRKMERLIFADASDGHVAKATLFRMLASIGSEDPEHRIISAAIDDDVLTIRSASFDMLTVPLDALHGKLGGSVESWREFRIDDYGEFIHWPATDTHMGWVHLKSIINPIAAVEAQSRSAEFNANFGAAIRSLREEHGLSQESFEGVSSRTLRRVERGETRATAKVLACLARGHDMSENDYLAELARRSKAVA